MDILPKQETQFGRRLAAGAAAATAVVACNALLVRATPDVSPQTAESAMEFVCQVPQYRRLDVCQPPPPTQIEQAQRQITEAVGAAVVQPLAHSVIAWVTGPRSQ